MAQRFTKAKSEQAFFKAALYGRAGSGKTLTSLLWAEGLAAREGKRVAFVDSERGTEFYAMNIKERKVHPDAFDFDRIITRSLMETLEAVEEIDTKVYGALVIDSVTHLWEAARAAYTGKTTSTGGIPIQAWGAIKRPFKKLMALFLDGNYHAIMCGREGVVLEKDEDGELEVVGTKMKSEGESPHEPHVLGRMESSRQEGGGFMIRTFFEKDRSGILTGRTFDWPSYSTIEPVVSHLRGAHQGKLGTPEENAEIDVALAEKLEASIEGAKLELYQQIRDAINSAHSLEALKAAWSLTQGKKGKLSSYFDELESIKDARKVELLREVA
jgi:hypothetical protein